MSYSGSAGGGIGGVSPASTPLVAAVPGTKILLCKSGVKDKTPDPAGAEYGEVFVNYHSGSPMLCFKDNAGEIVEIKPTRSIDGGGGETPPSTGNEVGDTLWDGVHFRVWDGSTWVAIGPNDLAYVQKVDGGTITNSAGSDVDIPVVNNIQAGLMLPADKVKLDTYPANAADLEVDLGYTAAADKGTVTNTNGDDAEIPLATGTNAGLSLNNYTTAEKDKLAGVEDGAEANVGTDLDYTPAAGNGTVTSSTGDDATIPLATGTNAGLMAPGDKNKLDGYPASPDDISGTLDLQAVTDIGNTTTNGASFSGGNISLNADGSSKFTDTVAAASFYGDATGTALVWYGGTTGTSTINADGSASFAGGNITLNASGSALFAAKVTSELTVNADPENTLTTKSYVDSRPAGQAGTLQEVTDAGNTTTNGATFADGDIALNADGSAMFAGGVKAIRYETSGTATPGFIHNDGTKNVFAVQHDRLLLGNTANLDTTPQIELNINGSASFAGGNITLNPDGGAFFSGSGTFGIAAGARTVISRLGGIFAVNDPGINPIQFRNTSGANIFTVEPSGKSTFAGEVIADTFKYSGLAPSPALAGKEIDLVATLHLMAAKLAELGGVDVASLFVANDPAPVTQPADPADDEDASSAY